MLIQPRSLAVHLTVSLVTQQLAGLAKFVNARHVSVAIVPAMLNK